VLRLGAIEC